MSESSSSTTELSVLGRFALFVRQVVAELRKVIWPTRKELIAYTVVVLVFVAAMAGIVAVLDYVFTQGVLAIFG
ncbi:MAG: preprotein translocase subunit SecE [Candidatus Nanopelagicales bacterium]